jgi:hypothetical protein
MLKSIATLASIVAVTTAYAEEVRVMSGGIEHVYGRGGQVLDSPELRAKNERAERQMRSLDEPPTGAKELVERCPPAATEELVERSAAPESAEECLQ